MSISKYEKVIDYAIRRGFIWQSYEIYGGQSGFYDLGPLGVMLKNSIIDLWREYFVKQHQDFVVEIETPIITPAIVFRASGHEESFTDYAVECLNCHRVYRADHLVEEVMKISAEGLTGDQLDEIIEKNNIRCPVCKGPLSKTKKFLLLFQTYIGPYTPENLAYLRPEAAQGMFINFKRVYELMRRKLPLGIAQIGRVARNEISPRQGPIRLREFTIMEIEFFYDDTDPKCDILFERCSDKKIRILTAQQREQDDDKPIVIPVVEAYKERFIKSPWLAYWMCVAHSFVSAIGVPEDRTYFEEKLPTERAHYSKQTFDQMVIVDKWGKLEVSGHAYRQTYDIDRHIKFSNTDLYAIRQLSSPKIQKKRRIKIDKTMIVNLFGPRSGEVFRALYSLGEDRLAEIVEEVSRDRIILSSGIEIPKSVFKIEDVEEQIWAEKFIPHVAEPSFGAERLLYIALEYAYTEDEGRVILRFQKRIAPIKVAITPLVDREPLTRIAIDIYKTLKQHYYSIYIEGGSIGKKYAYADELGIPYVITVDYESTEKADVTIRDRDTRKQIRVPINELTRILDIALKGGDIFSLGVQI